ncbi:acyl carrier protein [Micromonospora wenchangensis]|uniref:Actinorhodin polyketide synthase n=1 Tax=Micromonospora wenchangensis TaxID=1185415 RepID=A0A246RS38_9ACTN|nr:acyl carrier protein [Micromonospora wenchangensis]OWV11948.1 actinorhodin polyketide synthase [Micromonospora wenchangensis]
MRLLTVTELLQVVRECAGGDDHRGAEADLADTPFEELGYDSLALLETAGRLEREYHVKLTDEMVGEARTPQRLADLVNGELQRR